MRAVRGLLLAAAITPLLGACVIYDSGGEDKVSVRVGSHTTTAWSDDSEVLRAVRFEPGALVVRADSNGCTEASSFAVEVAEGRGTDAELGERRSAPQGSSKNGATSVSSLGFIVHHMN